MQVIRKSLEDKDAPQIAIDQIKSVGDSLPITLPIFWTSLAVILEQLTTDLFTKHDRNLGTLETLTDSVISILEYSLSSLGHELGDGVFVYDAKSISYNDIAAFMTRHKRDDWMDFFAERLYVESRDKLDAIDLLGKDGILTTRVWTPPLSADDMLDLQGRGLRVEVSPAASRWYDEYLPQIIGRELKIIALRRGRLLQKGKYVIGLHMEDYEKAGLG